MKVGRFFSRFFLLCFMCVWFGGLGYVAIAVIAGILAGKTVNILPFAAAFFFLFLFGSTLCGEMLRQCAIVQLSETCVQERILFKVRSYRWDEIKQAGILSRCGRGMSYNEIVLLKPEGSARRDKDWTFVLRNVKNLIHIPYSEDARNYVVVHYGPLDFDLSN